MEFCYKTSSIWRLIGYAFFAVKIIVPLIIIILGMIDFAKAVTAAKDDQILSAAKSLLRRLIIGIVIFFIPKIVSIVLGAVQNASEFMEASQACQVCLLDPLNDECANYVKTAAAERKGK